MSPLKYREKRRFPRVSVQFDLIYKVNDPPEVRMKVGDQQIHASLVNVSEAGMALQTDQHIPEATELEILFHLIFTDRQTPPMYAVGRVRHVSALPTKKGYKIGIEFLDIDEADKKIITEFIKKLPPEKIEEER